MASDDALQQGDLSSYRGRCFLYVLAMAGGEDLLKVGMTHDPLQRWSAFHPRWFEAFDLEHSLLIETERRGDAQALETALHRLLVEHRAPVPLTMRLAAGGASEWYRGAAYVAHDFVIRQQTDGFVVHVHASHWLQQPMRRQQERLFELLQLAQAEQQAGWLDSTRKQALQNLLDAHRRFDPELERALPDGLLVELGIG